MRFWRFPSWHAAPLVQAEFRAQRFSQGGQSAAEVRFHRTQWQAHMQGNLDLSQAAVEGQCN